MATSLGELATRFGCDLNGDPDTVVESVASLPNAGPRNLGFLSNSKLKSQLSSTKAAAVIVRAEDADDCPVATLVTTDPYATYARMAAVLHPLPDVRPGIHSSAVVDESASVSDSAEVCANTFIGARTSIGANVYVGPGTVIGPDCDIGSGCRFIANVSLPRNVSMGERCAFHPGVVIGADGFGNALTPDGWVRVPQVGGVTLGSDVEIGANTTIDCGAIDDTVLGDGVRIDNLCMVGHNVKIGAHTAIASSTAIAGSAIIGERCLFGGQAGSVGHVTICDDVFISGRGMVTKNITEPGTYASGFPAEKVSDWNRRVARLRRIDTLYDRVSKLEKGE